MAERLGPTRRDVLQLEQRVPETHSASQEEHRWHRREAVKPVVVTKATASEVLEHADVLLASAPDRPDYVYRVVLVSTETTGWVIA